MKNISAIVEYQSGTKSWIIISKTCATLHTPNWLFFCDKVT